MALGLYRIEHGNANFGQLGSILRNLVSAKGSFKNRAPEPFDYV